MAGISKIERVLTDTSNRIETVLKQPAKMTHDDLKSLHVELKEAYAAVSKTIQGSSKIPIADKVLERIRLAMVRLQQDPAAQQKVAALQTTLFFQTVKEFDTMLITLQRLSAKGKKVSKIEAMPKLKDQKGGNL